MSKRVMRDHLYLVPFLGAKTKERIHFEPCKFTFHVSVFRKVAFKSVCSTIHPSSLPHIHLSIYQLIDSTIHLFIYLSTQPSIYLSTHISIHMHAYICGSVCTHTHPFTHLCVRPPSFHMLVLWVSLQHPLPARRSY